MPPSTGHEEQPDVGGTMSYRREAEAQFRHPPEHAFEPTPFPEKIPQRMIPRRSSGWDPYEVWRTRVKEPRDCAEEAFYKVR